MEYRVGPEKINLARRRDFEYPYHMRAYSRCLKTMALHHTARPSRIMYMLAYNVMAGTTPTTLMR